MASILLPKFKNNYLFATPELDKATIIERKSFHLIHQEIFFLPKMPQKRFIS